MPKKILSFCLVMSMLLGLAACAVKPSAAQEEKHSEPPAEKKYALDSFFEVAGRQGIAVEGDYYYVSGSTALYKYDSNKKLIAENTSPFEGYELEVNHIGDIDVYNNEIYVSAEYFMDGVGTNIQIAVYDANTLKLVRTFPFNEESGQEECSGIAVDEDTKTVVMVSWVGEESGRYIYRYELETGAYLGKVHLQAPPQWLQGIAYHDGWYYMTADDGTADLKEADHIYRTQIIPGQTYCTTEQFYTLNDVNFQGEIEGITFTDGGDMLVLYNRGSRIVLGMVKGFYDGYDREISEVFVYKRGSN